MSILLPVVIRLIVGFVLLVLGAPPTHNLDTGEPAYAGTSVVGVGVRWGDILGGLVFGGGGELVERTDQDTRMYQR